MGSRHTRLLSRAEGFTPQLGRTAMNVEPQPVSTKIASTTGRLVQLCGSLSCLLLGAVAASAAPTMETVEQALCRLIEDNARSNGVPVEYLTRLIWQESSFRPGVTSRAGAQGVAQFMPGTAQERGLLDPFDPEQAIPKAAEFIAELTTRFGNRGLAAAAYNGGPARVLGWLAAERDLPPETRHYVEVVTGRSAEHWADRNASGQPQPDPSSEPTMSCLQVTALLRRPAPDSMEEAPFAPWGVQLAGNFSKDRALRSFARASQNYAAALGDFRPMVIGTRLRSRGTRTFYRVRVPAASRDVADRLCGRIRSLGGSCIVLPS